MPTADELHEDFMRTQEYAARQDASKNRDAAKFAHVILDEILDYIRPGMWENEVKNFALTRFEVHKVERPWHMPYIRFGTHTLLTYKEKAKEDRVLEENDIAFADIGVVYDGIEGDAGRTICFGENAAHMELRDASKAVFDEALEYWQKNDPNGDAFYEHIYVLSKRHNAVFNLDPAGHLIGTFPHRGWKRGINHFPHKLDNGVWILEIQLRHPTLPFGAFFEDILIR